jgi:carbon storage regulator
MGTRSTRRTPSPNAPFVTSRGRGEDFPMRAGRARSAKWKEHILLVVRRKVEEEIVIGPDIRIKVLAVEGERVKIGIVAPRDVTILRQELLGKQRPTEEKIAQ